MSLAMRLPALPPVARELSRALSGALAGLRSLWQKHHWPLVAFWLAFVAGLIGADLWFSYRHVTPMPEAELAIGPIPPPLVAGVNPVDQPLDPAPAPGLEEITQEGKLPVIAKDGRTPLAVYAYPFDHTEARPRISIVLTDVGPQTNLLNDAMAKLPGSVALAFNAYTPALGTAMAAARQAGHETLLLIPADGPSPLTYDPGPGALRLELSAPENMQRLHIIMGKATGYVGLMVNPETALLQIPNLAGALLTESQQRGLELLSNNQDMTDLGASSGSPTAQITLALDSSLDPDALDERLAELEQRAREGGQVVATSALYPFVINKLAQWLPTLESKGIAIAPVSAAANPIKSAVAASPEAPAAAENTHTEPAHAGETH